MTDKKLPQFIREEFNHLLGHFENEYGDSPFEEVNTIQRYLNTVNKELDEARELLKKVRDGKDDAKLGVDSFFKHYWRPED